MKTLEPLHEWLETWALAAKNMFVYDEKGFRENRSLGRFSIVGGHEVLAVGTASGDEWSAAEGVQEKGHRSAVLCIREEDESIYALVSSWSERVWSRDANDFFERVTGRCVLSESMTFLVNTLSPGEIRALGSKGVVELLRK